MIVTARAQTANTFACSASSSSAAVVVVSALRGAGREENNDVSSKSGLEDSRITRSSSASGNYMKCNRSTPNMVQQQHTAKSS